MAASQMGGLLRHLGAAAGAGADGEVGPTDGELLTDYLVRGEEAALAALVRRHGPMVWGVCRRVLGRHHDAEDAFQATFLVLVRRAASIASPARLANWLYGVAHQTARKARAVSAKRGAREMHLTELPEPAAAAPGRCDDLLPVLDEELSRLPDIYRVAIVLCELEGKTRRAAARQLGVPEGTLAGRLTRGRALLARRLARHGLAVTGGSLAAMLPRAAASAALPRAVVVATIKAAGRFAAGPAGLVSARVAALTEGVLKQMLLTKLKGAVAVLLVVAAAAGAGLGGLVGLAGEPAPPQPATSPPPREGDKPTGQPPPAVTAEQVKDRLAERQKRFRSLYVEYSVTGRPEVDIKRLWSWNMPLYPDDKREEKVGFAGDKRYFAFKSAELKPPLAPGDLVPDPAAPAAVQRSVKAIRAAWEDNPAPALSGSDYETVFDGRTLWSRPKEGAAFGRPAPVKPGDDLESVPVSLPSAYLEAIGLRPPSPRGEDTDPDHDHWPPESFKRFTKLGTRDEPEIVDGRPCLVFRAERTVSGDESYRAEQYGKDRTEAETWWLDPDLGWAPRKRELTANGLLVARWESSRFEEAGPGCWLPTAVRWTTGTPTWAAEEFRGKPAQTWAMKVSFWEVNGGDRLDKMLRVKLTDPVKGEGKREGDR